MLGILFRGVLCAVCLLPPTLLMGATLPAIARWVEATPQGVSWLGFFYGGNIAGAVFGCLLAGFYLLRVHDMATATLVAAAINVAVALAALLLARWTTHARADAAAGDTQSSRHVRAVRPVYVAIALSGLSALGAEVIWTRLLSLLFGGTVYTFSIILGTFLAGLGIGSSVGAWLARTSERPGLLLAACQAGAMVSMAWAALLMTRAFPYWPIDPSLAAGPLVQLPGRSRTCCAGHSAGRVLLGRELPARPRRCGRDAARIPAAWSGGVYAANTVGAILGALLFSLLVIAGAGSQDAQRWLIAMSALAALWMLWTAPSDTIGVSAGPRLAAAAAVILVAVLAVTTVGPVPPALIAYGRQIASPTSQATSYLYTGEGLNSSIAVSEQEGGIRNFHVSGKVEASSEVHDMRLQRLLGHMSALMHPNPRTVLVVGFGAGVTAGSFVLHPSVERIVICEIEPLIPEVVSRYFSTENYDVLHDPRVEVVYDDARHFILTTREKFDVITSDPIHPWVKGAASLYTKEYFELVKSHLNPGGVITQWVPLYESTRDVVKSEIATFFDVFPYGTIWSNEYVNGDGYDVVLLAKPEPLTIDPGDAAGAARSAGPRLHCRGTQPGRVRRGSGPAVHLRGPGAGSGAVAGRRGDQPRREPQAPVPGGHGQQRVRQQDLSEHARVPAVSGRPVHRLRRVARAAAAGGSAAAAGQRRSRGTLAIVNRES